MPANPDNHGLTWDPRPDFGLKHDITPAEPEPYIVQSESELAYYLEKHADLPELEVYNWLGPKPELARELAATLFRPVYELGIDACVVVQAYEDGTELWPSLEVAQESL